MTKFVGLRAKTYSCLIDDDNEDKKAKCTKKCVVKRGLKFENYENCLETTQLENKINYLEKVNLTWIVLQNHKQFIRNNKSILKTQQRRESERHNAFTEEINKIALSSKDYKRITSIDLIERYAHGTKKYLVSEKGMIKCNNIINWYNNY